VCLNIFSYLSTKQSVKLGAVCKQFFNLLNDESFWEHKAKEWVHLANVKGNNGSDSTLGFYVKKYKENEEIAKNIQKSEKKTKRAARYEKFKLQLQSFCEIYWSFLSMEVFLGVTFTIWTLFLALRADEVVLWDYHIVFLPMYLSLSHIFIGSLTVDFVLIFLNLKSDTIHWEAKSTLTLMANQAKRYPRTKIAMNTASAVWLISFITLAECKDEDTTVESSLIPLLLSLIWYSSLFCLWRANGQFCSGTKCGLSFLGLAVLYGVWIILSIWAKADGYADYNWYVAFVPVWILLIGGTFAVMALAMLLVYSGEWVIIYRLVFPLIILIVLLTIFLGFLSWNLEQQDYDLFMWPWLVVYIPLFSLEVFGIGVLKVISQHL